MKLEELRKEIINNYMKQWTRINNTVTTWEINSDNSVSVSGDVYLDFKGDKLPFKFRSVLCTIKGRTPLDFINYDNLPDYVKDNNIEYNLEIFYKEGKQKFRYNKINL